MTAATVAAVGYQMSARDVVRSYAGKGDAATIHALQGVDLDIPSGSVTASPDRRGRGSRRCCTCWAARKTPSSGTITADELEITGLNRSGLVDYRRTIGFVFQHFALLSALTARDNVMVPVLP